MPRPVAPRVELAAQALACGVVPGGRVLPFDVAALCGGFVENAVGRLNVACYLKLAQEVTGAE